MSINKQKALNLLLVFTIFLSVIVPNIGLAVPYEVNGSPDNPSLTITKLQREPGALPEELPGTGGVEIPPADAVGVKGVEFTLTLKETFDPQTNEWTEVSGGNVLKFETNEQGKIVFNKENGLVLGRYDIQETDGPDYLILNPNIFTVDIPMTNAAGNGLNYNVQIYPKNELIRSAVELNKVGERGIILPGVIFELYKYTGTKENPSTSKIGGEYETDADGKIKIDNLAAGTYFFIETVAKEGYALNTTKFYFTVKKSSPAGQDVSIEWENIDDLATEGTVTNYFRPTMTKNAEGINKINRDEEFKYNIKIQTPGDIKKYQSFVVTDELASSLAFIKDGTLADGWTVTGATKGDGISLEENGQKLTWTIDPAKIQANAEITITFTVKIRANAELGQTGIENKAILNFNTGQGLEDSITADSNTVTQTDGGFRIIKVDKALRTRRLKGAEFKLTSDPEGNNIVNAQGTTIKVNGVLFTGLLEDLATNGNGEILITGLTPKTYYLHETKAPIDVDNKPYRLLTKAVPVEVVDSKDIREVTVANSKSGWNLPTTGGMGTIVFTIVGIGLMAMAVLLFLKGRKSAKN